MNDVPDSTKEWKKGYILNNNSLQDIKIRHQGDDPTNWFLGKKTFKIKTNKNEMIGLNQSYDLIFYTQPIQPYLLPYYDNH